MSAGLTTPIPPASTRSDTTPTARSPALDGGTSGPLAAAFSKRSPPPPNSCWATTTPQNPMPAEYTFFNTPAPAIVQHHVSGGIVQRVHGWDAIVDLLSRLPEFDHRPMDLWTGSHPGNECYQQNVGKLCNDRLRKELLVSRGRTRRTAEVRLRFAELSNHPTSQSQCGWREGCELEGKQEMKPGARIAALDELPRPNPHPGARSTSSVSPRSLVPAGPICLVPLHHLSLPVPARDGCF